MKFRIWDKVSKQMFYFSSLDEIKEAYGTIIVKLFIDKTLELMKFTGLTDLNGKEIYEGDLLEECEYASRKIPLGVCKVFWNPSSNRWDFQWIRKGVLSPTIHGSTFRILGNVFESPPVF